MPSGKTSELLVRLAVDAGSLVRTERLVEDLWGDTAVSTQRNTLQSKVSQLRKALGDSALVVGTSDGYRLDVDPRRSTCIRCSMMRLPRTEPRCR